MDARELRLNSATNDCCWHVTAPNTRVVPLAQVAGASLADEDWTEACCGGARRVRHARASQRPPARPPACLRAVGCGRRRRCLRQAALRHGSAAPCAGAHAGWHPSPTHSSLALRLRPRPCQLDIRTSTGEQHRAEFLADPSRAAQAISLAAQLARGARAPVQEGAMRRD